MKRNEIEDQKNIVYLKENYGKNILPLSLLENERMIGTTPNEILLFYKKGTPISKLEASLLKASEYYNLFSSRLIMIGHNKFALQYCTDGIKINLLPPLDITFDEINIDDIKKMMVHVKTLPGEPLLAVTGIPLKDGILGGISCSHVIGDGISVILFLYAWNCIVEGKTVIPPSNQRLFTGKPVDFNKTDKAFIPSLSELSDEIQNRVKRENDDIKLYTKREYFTEEFLNEIKKKAKAENPQYTISNNQIIISFLLKKYHNHILPGAEKIRLRNAISLREVYSEINPLFIGNAEFISMAEFTKDEIDTLSISQIAYRLKESIRKIRDEDFVKNLLYLYEYGIEFNTDVFKKYYHSYNIDTDINSSNLTHLNDLESLGLSSNIGSILDIDLATYASFMILKEKSGKIFTDITGRYPFV